ncbi:MAG: zinc-binding dehydrogenase [Acidimicrobiales bacterium]
MAAVVAGAETIVAVDLHDHRLELARELGATHTVRGDVANVVGEIHDITGGGAHHRRHDRGAVGDAGGARSAAPRRELWVRRRAAGRSGARRPGARGQDRRRRARGQRRSAGADPAPDRAVAAGTVPVRPADRDVPLSRIDEAEQASLRGDVVKPVLVPGA